MFEALDKKRTTYDTCPICQQKNALAITKVDERSLAYCFYGCPQDSVWRVIRGERISPSQPIEQKRPQGTKDHNEVKKYALELWQKSLPAQKTLVATYLAGRGIKGEIPASLRFLPNHLHKPSGSCRPVMLAAVTDCGGHLQAVHRTYLSEDGKEKAIVTPVKMTLAPIGGFACHLATAGEKLAVSEGIETGLSVLQVTGIPTWAALSAGGIRNLILPALPFATEVIVCADNDPIGLAAAHDAASRWREQRRRVRIAVPPVAGSDFNDVLQGTAT